MTTAAPTAPGAILTIRKTAPGQPDAALSLDLGTCDVLAAALEARLETVPSHVDARAVRAVLVRVEAARNHLEAMATR